MSASRSVVPILRLFNEISLGQIILGVKTEDKLKAVIRFLVEF